MTGQEKSAPVLFAVSISEVLLRFGLPATWRCQSAEYDEEANVLRMQFAYPLVAVDGPQVFVEEG